MEDSNLTKDPKILIQLAKNGDKEAFGNLYNLYFIPIFRYIYFRVKSKTEAEDLVQEVFLKVYQGIENFKDQNKLPLNYFFTIARNTLIDYWRKKKEVLVDEKLENISDKNADSAELVEQKETEGMIINLIKDLTEEQQEVIVLKFINDLTNREIAKLLGKSEEAIRQLQCRALKKLRKKFKDLNVL